MLRHRFLWRGWELEDWEQEERSFLVGERRPLTGWLFSQIHFTLELSSWEIELPSGLAMLRWRFDGFCVKWLHQALHEFWQALGKRPMLPWHAPWLCWYPWGSIGMSERSSSHFCGPKPMGFQAFFGLSWMLLWAFHLPKLLRAWWSVKLSIRSSFGGWRHWIRV